MNTLHSREKRLLNKLNLKQKGFFIHTKKYRMIYNVMKDYAESACSVLWTEEKQKK